MMIKMIDVIIITLSTQWYGLWEFNGDTQASTAFMNVYYGISIILGIGAVIVFGCVADRLNYRTLLPPVLLVSGIMFLPIYLSNCMTCWWTVSFLSMTNTVVIASNVVVSLI